MKSIISSLALVIAMNFSVLSQKGEVSFSGKITNATGKTLSVSGNNFSNNIDLNEDGSFSSKFEVEKGYYLFNDGRERATFYLKPGYDLKLTLDTKEFDETISYTGKGSENNNYLAKKYMIDEKLKGNPRELFAKSEKDFLAVMNSIKSETESLLLSLKLTDAEFLDIETKAIEYGYLTSVITYVTNHAYLIRDMTYKPSKELLAGVKDFDYENEEEYLRNPSYQILVQTHFQAMVMNPMDDQKNLDAIKAMKSEVIRNALLVSIAENVTVSNPNYKELYNGIMAISTDEAFKKALTEKMKGLGILEKGQPSPNFSFEDINGKMVSLDDLKGKYVYIDAWATWCAPCRAEIPHLKALEEQYHGKNIEFVSISLDKRSSIGAWKKMIEKKEMGGVQLISDNAFQTSFAREYQINSIPRFIFIDKEGNIVTANAPRPSEKGRIKELFNVSGM